MYVDFGTVRMHALYRGMIRGGIAEVSFRCKNPVYAEKTFGYFPLPVLLARDNDAGQG